MKYKALILSFSLLPISGATFADSASPKSTYNWTGVYVGGFVGWLQVLKQILPILIDPRMEIGGVRRIQLLIIILLA